VASGLETGQRDLRTPSGLRRVLGLGDGSWNIEPSPWIGVVLVAPALVLLGVFFLWPLVKLVQESLPDSSFRAYSTVFHSDGDMNAFVRTFVLSVITTALVIVVGGFLAWEMRTGSALKRNIIGLSVVFPLLTSVVIRNYSLTIILQRRGILNDLIVRSHLRDQPLDLLYTNGAVAIGMFYTMLPYAVLPLYAAFRSIDLDLVLAARSLGANGLRAFRRVVVPLSLPSVVSTAALVFVLSLGFYVTPILLGSAERPFVANRVGNHVFVFFDLPRAAAIGVVLLVAALVSVAAVTRWVGVERLQKAAVHS
jgi:putative spermidine/putrescine transport system permease protein